MLLLFMVMGDIGYECWLDVGLFNLAQTQLMINSKR